MPLRNPFSPKQYTDEEYYQIQSLQRFYIQDIDTDLHQFLQMSEEDDRTPRYASTRTDLERGTFQSRIGTSSLAMEAENLLVNVLQYQRSRYNDSFRNGYWNDPRNLLCEVIKTWVVDTLSHQLVNDKCLEDVDKWIKFIHHITMSSTFPPGKFGIETMEAMLVSFRNSLRYQVRPAILNELRSHTSREHLQSFIHATKRVLSHGIQFLYFALRDTKDTPTNCTVPNLQIGCILMDKVLQTSSGRLLQTVVLTNSYLEVFPVGYVPGGRDHDTELILDTHTDNPFEFKEGKPIIPSILLELYPLFYKPKKNKILTIEERQIILENYRLPIKFFDNDYSGIAKPFRNKQQLLENFLLLHCYLVKLATFVKLLEQAKSLSGEGGDLLIYGIARKSVASLISDFNILSNCIRDASFTIEKYADGLYQQIIRENKNSESQWKQNYLLVSGISMLFNEDLDNCHRLASKIRQQATCYSLSLKEGQLKQNLNIFVNETSSFSSELKQLLSIPETIDEIEDNLLIPTVTTLKMTYPANEEVVNPNTSSDDSDQVNIFEKREERKNPTILEIISISPTYIPTNGNVKVQVYCKGITRASIVHIENDLVEETFNAVEDVNQNISFISPIFATPGERVVRVTNPDGSYAQTTIQYIQKN